MEPNLRRRHGQLPAETGETVPLNNGTTADGHLSKPAVDTTATGASMGRALAVLAYLVVVVSVSMYCVMRLPVPLPATAPEALFSEERAMRHVRALADDIPERQVSMPGIHEAADYLERQMRKIAEAAEASGRFTAQVDRESLSGAADMDFFHHPITNAYHEVTVLWLWIAPLGMQHQKALLLTSHYDSAIASPGASDCASCVATLLEATRALVASDAELLGPLLVAVNGAEESLMQASHGMMHGSRWSSRFAAFVDLESTGSSGPCIVFQHTGAWMLEAFARAAPHPCGSSLAQDVFEAGLVPADSDYKMLSAKHYGTLPGIDLAVILDAASYHTYTDTADRIQPGTLQQMGDIMLRLTPELLRQLQPRLQPPLCENRTQAAALPPLEGDAVYFDMLGFAMVRYTKASAAALHMLPLVAALVLPSLRHNAAEGSLGRQYRCILAAAAWHLGCLLGSVALPVAVAVLRILLFGKPMAWFSQSMFAAAAFIPAGMAGLMLIPPPRSCCAAQQLHGCLLLTAACSAALAALDAGSAYLPMLWACASLIASLLQPLRPRGGRARGGAAAAKPDALPPIVTWREVAGSLAAFTPPCMITTANMIAFLQHVMQKSSMGGSAPQPFTPFAIDVVIAFLLSGAAMLCVMCLVPLLHAAFAEPRKVLVAALLACSMASCVAMSWADRPYSASHPKRLIVQHLHTINTTSSAGPKLLAPPPAVAASRWVYATLDAVPASAVLRHMPSHRPPAGDARDGMRPAPQDGRELQSLYPVSSIAAAVAFHAAAPAHHLPAALPTVSAGVPTPVAVAAAGSGAPVARVPLEVALPKAGWGVLNITGLVSSWSISTPLFPPAPPTLDTAQSRFVRFAGEERGRPRRWALWVEAVRGSVLTVELSLSYLDITPELQQQMDELPAWVAPMPITTYQQRIRVQL